MENNDFEGIVCYNVDLNINRSSLSDESGYLVLESNPFPDYYAKQGFPPNKKQQNWRLFLLVKNSVNCFQDLVLRNAYSITKILDSKFEIMPSQLTFSKKSYQCIRLNISNTNALSSIIKHFENEGLSFIKNRKTSSFNCQVYFKRYTQFVKIDEGVYRDKDIEGRYFFEINNNIDFDVFLEGITKIKNSCDYHLFDSFQAFAFKKEKIQDFIGIYSEHCDKNKFSELKQSIKKTFEV